jgi:hypothetical protein
MKYEIWSLVEDDKTNLLKKLVANELVFIEVSVKYWEAHYSWDTRYIIVEVLFDYERKSFL